MTTHNQAFVSDALAAGEPAAPLSNRIRSIALRFVAWVDTCADYYAAAAIYEQLSALSDSELARRGLARATLAHDVRAACDRGFDVARSPLAMKPWATEAAVGTKRDGERARLFEKNKRRRNVVNNIIRFAVTLGTLIGANAASLAQTYPDRPVKIVVPFAPAGPTDVIARIVADKLSISLGKQFYVENRAGAGGNTGTAAVAASPADGYTLIAVATGFVVNPSLFAKVPYDPVKDFAPISIVAVSPNVVTVNPSVPAKSVNELIALIKANPGKFSFASPGVGSTSHLSGEIFRMSQGIDLVVVQFTGAGPAIQNTVGGHTPIAFTALPPAAPQITDGKLRALAVTSEKRVRGLPDVPTVAEAGLHGQEAYTLTGMLAPAGTPKAIIDLLHGEIAKIVKLPDVQKRLDDLGFDVVANSPDDFAARIKTDMEKWGKVIRDAKIKPQETQ